MTEATSQSSLTLRDLMKIGNFRLLWIGQSISDFGDALTALALVLWINRLTNGSTSAIAWLMIMMALPTATIGLLAGVFVDRWSRKRVMILSDLLRGLLVLIFAIDTFAGWHSLWLLYAVAFLMAAIGSFFSPARGALIAKIVPTEGLLSANSLAQISSVLFRVLGTAAAGLLVGVFGTFWPAFVVDALTFFVSLIFVRQTIIDERVDQSVVSETQSLQQTQSTPQSSLFDMLRQNGLSVWQEMRAGLQIITQSRLLVGMLVATAVTMLGLGAINVLMAPFLVNDLGVLETWFGAIEFIQAAGMVISGATVALLLGRLRPTTLISGGLFGVGLCILATAWVTQIWPLLPILFAVGLLMTPAQAAIATLMQREVDNRALGRVGAALNTVITLASLLSMFAAGTLAAWLGVRNVFLLSGAIACSAALLSAWIFQERQPTPQTKLEVLS